MMFDIEQSIIFSLVKAHQCVTAEFRAEYKEWGISPPQFFVLAFLWSNDGLSQVELSKKSKIDRTTIGGIIDQLEKAGFLRRQSFPLDRRAHRIVLTEKGRSLEEDLCKAACRVQDRIVARISPDGYTQLQNLLSKLAY
jgi:DNA-binding MarR family transcriptional regulator